MVSTGISLGSNYSIAFGSSDPGWFSAIVPVSTQGDSRDLLLRNLKTVPVYILEGSKDKNIRAISGPRSLRDILSAPIMIHNDRILASAERRGRSERREQPAGSVPVIELIE